MEFQVKRDALVTLNVLKIEHLLQLQAGLAPPVRERPVSIELPTIQTLADSVTAMGAVLDHVASGELTPSEGVAIAGMVETFRRTIETQELEVRISALEQKAGA